MIAAPAALPLPLIDLTGMPAAEREAELMRLAATEAGRPFDLARGPLIRAALLRLAADEHVLLLTLHQIVCDSWSIGVLLRELTALYAAFVDGRTAALPGLPIQYADYAHWQRARLRDADEHGATAHDYGTRLAPEGAATRTKPAYVTSS